MSSEDTARVSNAASMLVKGGTLTSDPCPKCGGVQVKFADKMTCINCGHQHNAPGAAEQVDDRNPGAAIAEASTLAYAAPILEDKISGLVSDLRDEKDISLQKQKAELLEIYLRLLEKIRSLNA
ncbi:MAG: Sjogren's syndrome/scleroderma autoantigen 1 family protein [Nitrososphaera sp.]